MQLWVFCIHNYSSQFGVIIIAPVMCLHGIVLVACTCFGGQFWGHIMVSFGGGSVLVTALGGQLQIYNHAISRHKVLLKNVTTDHHVEDPHYESDLGRLMQLKEWRAALRGYAALRGIPDALIVALDETAGSFGPGLKVHALSDELRRHLAGVHLFRYTFCLVALHPMLTETPSCTHRDSIQHLRLRAVFIT